MQLLDGYRRNHDGIYLHLRHRPAVRKSGRLRHDPKAYQRKLNHGGLSTVRHLDQAHFRCIYSVDVQSVLSDNRQAIARGDALPVDDQAAPLWCEIGIPIRPQGVDDTLPRQERCCQHARVRINQECVLVAVNAAR